MTDDKGIFIKNIYYMLSYAFQVLRQSNYEDIAAEDFEQMEDLLAAILARGIARQLKQGLHREYVPRRENLAALRGKADIPETIKNRLRHRRLLSCEYDELSENNICNRLLKTTAEILMHTDGVSPERRKALGKVMLFFDGIDTIPLSEIRWDTLQLRCGSQTYEMLMNICRFVLEGLLQTTEKGTYRMAAFSDENMARLYEKFVLEYYRRHHSHLHANALQVKWALDDTEDESALRFLPRMETDIALRCRGKTLIIETKYYARTLPSRYERHRIRSGHLYQIYAYVKNLAAVTKGEVSGVLLYAKTGEALLPDGDFSMGGNRISVKTLDLNTDFRALARQLDEIAGEAFGKP